MKIWENFDTRVSTHEIWDFGHETDLKLALNNNFCANEELWSMAFNRRKNRFCTIILGRLDDENQKSCGQEIVHKFILCRVHSSW